MVPIPNRLGVWHHAPNHAHQSCDVQAKPFKEPDSANKLVAASILGMDWAQPQEGNQKIDAKRTSIVTVHFYCWLGWVDFCIRKGDGGV